MCHAQECLSPGGAPIAPPSSRRHTMKDRETKHVVTEAKEYVIQTIGGVGDVAGAIVGATSDVLTRTLQGTRASGAELRGLVTDTVIGTIHGVAQVGGEVE